MATYLPNIQGVYPDPPILNVDFNRIERMLRQRENLYAQGAQKVKNLYETAFSSQMLRPENIKKRDEYLRSINEGLRTISSMDLSLPQNQALANSLFEPVLSDNDLIKDIVFTKQYYSQKSKAESLRTSSDPKQLKQYWQTGIDYLDYQAQDFAMADAETARNMPNPTYVPNVDIMGMAEKMYKDAGISVKKDVISGGYIWSYKNGDVALPIAQSFVETMLSQTPGAMDMLKVQALVQRRKYIDENAPRFGGDKVKAEQEYLKAGIEGLMKANADKVQVEDKELAKLRAEVESWKKVESARGIVYGSEEFQKYEAAKQKLNLAEQLAEERRNNTMLQEINNMDDLGQLRNAIDNAVVIDGYSSLVNGIATNLAYKNAEVTAKVDPYSLAEFKNALSERLENVKLQNRKAVEQVKGAVQSALESQKQRGRKEMGGVKHRNVMEEIKERNKGKKTSAAGTKQSLSGLFGGGGSGKTTKPEEKPKKEKEEEQERSFPVGGVKGL